MVDFTNTVIIATSNVGSELIQENLTKKGKEKKPYDKLKDALMEVLRLRFRPEFLNRIDDIIVFHSLDKKQIRQIVELQLERVRRVAHGQGIVLEFQDSLIDYLANRGYAPEYGARELLRLIKSELENKLAQEMLKGSLSEGSAVIVSYDSKKGVLFKPAAKTAARNKGADRQI